MNEKRIQEVLEIEKQAQAILDSATNEAARLPIDAGREADELIATARAGAEEEARRIVAAALAENETATIKSKAEAKTAELDQLAAKNLERAVAYVLDRLAGKE